MTGCNGAEQVLHSDLKTKNILLTKSGTAKIGDVGLSEFLEHNFNSPDKIACAPHGGQLQHGMYAG